MKRKPNYTVKELAIELGVSERTIRRWLAKKGVAVDEDFGNGWTVWHHDFEDRCYSAARSLGLVGDDEDDAA